MNRARIPFYKHDLGQAELDAIAEVFRGEILTTGDVVAEFESRFAGYLGVPHVLAVTSCTGAMHMALLALGIGPGDEVITTPMSFVATANAIVEAGATPVFVDVEPDTGNLDAARIEAALTPRTRGILPVHLYGLMCDMREIRRIADAHGLFVVEDAAHCVEGVRDGIRPGQLSDMACFSFFATKNLTCGEGGAVTARSAEHQEALKLLRLHGMTKSSSDRWREGWTPWDMISMGWKYNLSNIDAAMLLPQLDRIDRKLAERDELAAAYDAALAGIEGLTIPASRPSARHARHLYTVWLPDHVDRNVAVDRLRDAGVNVVVNYLPIHAMTYYRETLAAADGAFPVAERIGRRTISVPFYPGMPRNHIAIVADAIRDLVVGW